MQFFPTMLLWVLAPVALAFVLARPELLLGAVVLVIAQRFVPDPFIWLRTFSKRQRLAALVSQNPANAAAARQLAMLHLHANAPRRAAAVLELAKARSADAETLYLLGFARLRSGDPTAALVDLDAAVALDDKIRYGDAHLARGTALLKLNRTDEAAAALTRFVAINTSSIEGHVRMAQVERARGNTAAARAARKEALDTWRVLPGFRKRGQRLWWARALLGL